MQQMALEEYVDLVRQVDKPLVSRILGIATVFLLALQLRKALVSRNKLKSIPTAGSSGIIGSWIDAFRFISHAKEIVEEGQRMCGSIFKVPLLDRWTIVVSGADKINDLRKASVEQLSSIGMSEDMDYAFGSFIRLDPFHVDIVRGPLTCNIGACFADVQDEIKAAFKDYIPITEDWVEIPTYETILQIVCRASNRMFVGLPLCRNREYIKLNTNYTIEIFTFDRFLHLLPTILKTVVSSIYTPRKNAVAKAEKFLGKTIRERLEQQNLHGKIGQENQMTSSGGCLTVLTLNIGAIHTTSMTFTTALCALAAHPEYAETLRNEVESIINEEGYTKAAMGKMNQLDSFVKEAQRVYGTMSVFGMHRTTRKDFMFSDGTVVPAGVQIVVAILSTHTDEENYKDPLEFKPWRFSEMRKQGENIRHHMATPSLDFVFFGHGRPACPGRFFAINELKALMSYVLLNFDVKIDKFPTPTWFSDHQIPN
ncbi:cytochrome P450 [Desarmillaria tabescens]|uniref:Cytochrome P450 n=1 Tax=Armillaria tabescens TaxID=1929756 RepID=A0AA39N7V7_ARMTA|nr:cytochrome P450 [Desarmillaria tabescens]KAK0460651.1 cytochrome P450 [Desarmillaria tabescens]